MAEPPHDVPWPQMSALIAAHTGLHFPPERHADLQRGLEGAAAELGFINGAALARSLLSVPPTQTQLQTLACHLTIGETYFFRERRVFEVLAAQVIPELLERRRTGRSLRLWSAACCTGEEPYSLSILLQQCVPDLAHWHATVLATDINERFLQKAEAGVYGEWSFRDVPQGLREQYFTRMADGRHAVLPQIRQRVRFAPLNLVAEDFPARAPDTQGMDLIFCRNVLMYFTAAQAARVVQNLHRVLRDDGWLVLSATESAHALSPLSGFTPVIFSGITLYRRSGTAAAAPPAVIRTADPLPLHDSWPTAPALAAEQPEAVAEPPQYSVLARSLANQGRLQEALSCCDRWIAAEPLDSGARYLRAVILEETGQTEAARQCLQQTLFLDPDFVLAHFALGNLARGAHRMQEAQRHLDNALALLNRLPADEPLPESDGLTAGRLKAVIESLYALENVA